MVMKFVLFFILKIRFFRKKKIFCQTLIAQGLWVGVLRFNLVSLIIHIFMPTSPVKFPWVRI